MPKTCFARAEDTRHAPDIVADGETGDRLSWLGHERDRFDNHPQLQLLSVWKQEGKTGALYQIKRGSKLRFESLGYGDFVRESYAIFERLQAQGGLPQNLRFQISLPTPLNMLSCFDSDQREQVEAALVEAFNPEIQTMVCVIPPDKLALLWDMPRETVIL